jgi:hypothetical protein
MSPMRYELRFHISKDCILHSHRRENLESYIALTGRALWGRLSVFPVRYELGFISEKSTFFIVTAVKAQILQVQDSGPRELQVIPCLPNVSR